MRMTWHVYVFHQFVLGRMCPSGTQRTMKHQQASPGGSEIRLEAARPLADDKCVSVICWLRLCLCACVFQRVLEGRVLVRCAIAGQLKKSVRCMTLVKRACLNELQSCLVQLSCHLVSVDVHGKKALEQVHSVVHSNLHVVAGTIVVLLVASSCTSLCLRGHRSKFKPSSGPRAHIVCYTFC